MVMFTIWPHNSETLGIFGESRFFEAFFQYISSILLIMGDPTDPPRGSDDNQYQSDSGESDIDAEAEVIEPANSTAAHNQNINNSRNHQNRANSYDNGYAPVSDTVTSIISSISRPEAALVIPIEHNTADGEAEIDAERMERFYNGALNAITKV